MIATVILSRADEFADAATLRSTVLPMGVAVVLLLLILFVVKELSTHSESPRAQFLSRVVDVAIAPLSVAFVAIIVVKVAETLG